MSLPLEELSELSLLLSDELLPLLPLDVLSELPLELPPLFALVELPELALELLPVLPVVALPELPLALPPVLPLDALAEPPLELPPLDEPLPSLPLELLEPLADDPEPAFVWASPVLLPVARLAFVVVFWMSSDTTTICSPLAVESARARTGIASPNPVVSDAVTSSDTVRVLQFFFSVFILGAPVVCCLLLA